MVIDVHTHLMMGTEKKDKEEILRAAVQYDISKLYLSTLYPDKFYPTPEEITACNRETHRFTKATNGLVQGYCYVNPRNSNTLDVLKQGREEYGMPGVKLWVATTCDDPLVRPVAEWCVQHSLPLLVHAFYKAGGLLEHESTGVHVARLAAQYPKAKIIMAHLGANCYYGIKAIQQYPNVMVDISGSLCRGDDIDYTVEMIGAKRVLFGTDLPQPGSYLGNLGRIDEADLTPEQRRDILYNNAAGLFGEGAHADI